MAIYILILTAISVNSFLMLRAAVVQANELSKRCAWNQFTIVKENEVFCQACPKCPMGQGLSPQCGSYIKTQDIIKCVDCQVGQTFSDAHDLMSCKPCAICDPHEETLQNCTLTRNAECGKCHRGYYRAVTHDCHKCSWCCHDSKDDQIEEDCINQGLPRQQSCRYDFDTHLCAPRIASTVKETTTTSTALDKKEISDPFCSHFWLVAATFMFVMSVMLWTGTVLLLWKLKLSYKRSQYVYNNVDGHGKLKTSLLKNNNCVKKITGEAVA